MELFVLLFRSPDPSHPKSGPGLLNLCPAVVDLSLQSPFFEKLKVHKDHCCYKLLVKKETAITLTQLELEREGHKGGSMIG